MEGDLLLRRSLHSPPVPSDPEPLPELTRSGSDSSAITVDSTSKDLSHHCAAAPFPSRRWTDQLHSLYLSSLEASFVNELHRSLHLRGWSFHNNTNDTYKCRTLQNSPNMPGQSLALQDGCQKIGLEKIAPMLESTADSHVLTGSHLGLTLVEKTCSLAEPVTDEHDLLCDEEIHAIGNSALANRSASSLEKQCICCSFQTESGCSTTVEITDQNFKDEVASSSSIPVSKRLKTTEADSSRRDQVVPFGKFHTTDVSTSGNSTAESKGHELLSQLPERFHVPKSDLPYFLRDR